MTSLYSGYCWRDYSGVVPEDALKVGEDNNGEAVYIGQVYVHGEGVYFGAAHAGSKQVEVPTDKGPKKIDVFTKIFCVQNKDKFIWLRTSTTTFHLDTINKRIPIGGLYGPNNGNYSISRAVQDGKLVIGMFNGYGLPGNALNWTTHRGQNSNAVTTCEVLTYDPDAETGEVDPRSNIGVL